MVFFYKFEDIIFVMENKFIVFSDVDSRDGIGIEIYRNEKVIVEIFRDDTSRTRSVEIFSDDITLEEMEDAISIFKREIQWDFIEY